MELSHGLLLILIKLGNLARARDEAPIGALIGATLKRFYKSVLEMMLYVRVSALFAARY